MKDRPTSKFGEALRDQVEERLNFFETGAAPSKNADAIRKVLESLALDDAEDEDVDMEDAEPVLPMIEASPPPKKDKKKKKRSSEAMDLDEEDEQPTKKVKLSKEEKKALKKAAKAAKKEAEAVASSVAMDVSFVCFAFRLCLSDWPQEPARKEKKQKEKKEKKEKEKKHRET